MTDYTNTIEVWLNASDFPIVHTNSRGYQKDLLFCVFELDNKRVFKYPIDHIWRIMEDYPDEQRAHS